MSLMNSAAPNFATSTGSAQSAPAAAAGARRPEAVAPSGSSGGTAFEALLAATQLITPEALAGRLEASAEQMFEAPQASGQAGGEGAGPELDETLDPTSLTARKAARTAQQANAATQRSNDARTPKPASSTERGPASLERTPLSGKTNPAPTQNNTDPGRESFAATARGISQTKVAPPGGSSGPGAPAPTSAQVNSAPTITPVTADTAKPAGESIARQVGQVLNSMRGGEASTARTATAQAAPADGRAPASTEKNAQSSASQNSAKSETPAGAEKTDETRSSMFARLVRSIRLQGGPHGSSARIELDPPELGRMRIDVRLAGEGIRIGVLTERKDACDLLNERLAGLKSALEQHGLRVERVEVLTDPEALNRPEVPQDGTAGETGGDSSRAGRREADAGEARTNAQTSVAESRPEGENESVELETWAAAETRLDIRV